MSIKAGDKVKLNSGGPIMTVSTVYGTDATCEWFEKNDVKSHTFVITSLELYVPPPPMTDEEMNSFIRMSV